MRAESSCFAFSSSRLRAALRPFPARLMKYVSMRMPDAGPLSETFFEARLRAMTGAVLVNKPGGGCVESVVTFLTQRFFAGVLFAFFRVERDRVVMVSVPFEVLDSALMLLRLLEAVEGAEVAALARRWILLPRIEPILPGFQFADHAELDARAW